MTSKEFKLSQIKILRLMTKEVIICKIQPTEKENQNYWILEDPFEIRSYMNAQTGDLNSTLMDWLQFSSETETKICVTDVLTCNSPEEEVLEHYIAVVKRKKSEVSAEIHERKEVMDLVKKLKNTKESEITFDDYMDMLNNNKVYH